VLDPAAFGGGEDLPGHDFRVVVEEREHDQVARLDVLPCPRVRDEVDGLGRPARVDDLFGRGRVDEGAHLLARALVALRRLLGDFVGGAVDVGVVAVEVVQHRVGDLARPLGGVGRVEVGDAGLEDRKVVTNGCDVEDVRAVFHSGSSTYTSSPSPSPG